MGDADCRYRERPTYPRNRTLRREIFHFYSSFAMLTAFLIDLDIRTIRRATPLDGSRLLDLVSPPYIHALATLTRKEEILYQQTSQAQSPDGDFKYADEVSDILRAFQTYHSNQGGSMAHLAKLGQLHGELIGRFPKLCDNTGNISCLMANLTRESFEVIKDGARYSLPEVEQCKANVARAYQYFEMMSSTLSTIIDKHVKDLSLDCATFQLLALTEIYQMCLATDRTVPADVIQEHRKTHLPIANHSVPEAMAYHWKFTMYSRLIMSTQMQLRVMAASSMCGDLVSFWKRCSNHSDDATAFLKYLADFLVRTGLVAYILGPTCHPEITVESSNIVGFLLVSETYTDEHTDLLWQTITSAQDPRVSEALIRLTNRIANLYPYEQMLYLCEKLNSLAVDAFSPAFRELCSQIFTVLKQRVTERPVMDICPYLLCLRLARRSSVFGSRSPVAYPDLLEFSTHHFRDLLGFGPDTDGRRRIFLECLQDIGDKSQTSLGSLAILSHMFLTRPLQRELQILASENDLARLLVDEMESAITAGRAAGFPAVISGGHNAPRKDMIMLMVYGDASSITTELGHKLWDLLVGGGAACPEDRDVGWQILNHRPTRPQGPNPVTNSFISTCLHDYLPTLPPECFCAGTLEFVRASILPLVNDVNSIVLDDYEGSGQDCIEQLWRIVLTAPSHALAGQAIHTLVNDIYVESKAITSFPPYRARKVHMAVADRCLKQLSSSAGKLRQFTDGTASGDDLEPMVIVADDQQVQEQELLFVRSLAVLRELHQLHQAKTHFTVPDLSSLILDSPAEIEGDSAGLKYQAFEERAETDIEPLPIGRQNTVGSLLATLREVTGFANFRVFFRGQQFLPQESDVCRTLEDLQVLNGLLLVKRDPDTSSASPQPVRPGASPLENKLLAHFEELCNYLGMEEKLASEIYSFMVKLPPDENIVRAIKAVDVSYTELFPIGQPFKSLYAVYALQQCLSSYREQEPNARSTADWELEEPEGASGEYPAALSRGMSLIVAAMTDENILGQCPSAELRILLGTHLVQCFVEIVRDPSLPETAWKVLDAPLLERLVTICSSPAADSSPEGRTGHICLCLEGIFECCSRSPVFWSAFGTHEKALTLVKDSLLYDPRLPVRQHTASIIRHKVSAADQPGMLTAVDFAAFFWPLAFELIEPAMQHPPGTSELFSTCSSILRRLLGAATQELQADDLFSALSARLFAYTTYEDMTRPDVVDDVAAGLIGLMHEIVMSTDAPTEIGQSHFPTEAFWKLLFPPFEKQSLGSPQSSTFDSEMPRPILCTASRQKLIEIMLKLIEDSPDQMQDLVDSLRELVPYYGDDDGWSHASERGWPLLTRATGEPYAYELVPQFERSKAVRASCGYAGLKNLSNTCYLNSLFTQLFMNVPFRRFMMNARVGGSQEQTLLFETQKLFAFMQETLRRFVDPEDCVAAIKTYDDGQIDIHNQMDVDEFYNLLFDRWESQLKDSQARKQFRSFYGGQLVQQVRSNECEHISEVLEPFSAIQCDIKGKTCLQESLQAYVDGEIMEGDNKYKCSTCDRHVDAVKRACLKDIPDNLIFHLKRFDFNLRTMQRSKINDHFAFPTHIDMRPYTIQHLSNPDQDMEDDVFELVGVLVHSGTAESGHYYSYARERPRSKDSDVWVEFNDDNVSSWDPANMEHACFGGVDFRAPFDASAVYDKSWSAYMLFYQRASSLQKQQAAAKDLGLPIPLRAPIRPELKQYIQRENVSLLRRHCLYDPSHMELVITALGCLDRFRDEHPSGFRTMEQSALAMALGHLDQVASRAKDTPDFERLIQRVRDLVRTYPTCSLHVYEYFHLCRGAFRALVQRNSEAGVRSASSRLLIQAARQIKEHFPDRYGGASDSGEHRAGRIPVLRGMMNIFRVLLDYFHLSLRSWHEVFGFMVDYLQVGQDEMGTFLRYPFAKYLVQIISADPALDYGQQLARLVTTLSRRARPPSYDNIIRLISMVTKTLADEVDECYLARDPEDRVDVADVGGPYTLTVAEYKALTQQWSEGSKAPVVFLDKLIAIDQNFAETSRIIIDYMRLSRKFEDRVLSTLKGCISHQISAPGHLNAPFLRVGAHVYCAHARNANGIRDLISHVALQCKKLDNAEGMEFCEFQKIVFYRPHLNTGETEDDVVEQGYNALHMWVPFLLGYYDSGVARDVELFLYNALFAPERANVAQPGALEVFREARFRSALAVGLSCLEHLKERYTSAQANAPAQMVARYERVLDKCKSFFNPEEDGEDPDWAEFFRFYRRK